MKYIFVKQCHWCKSNLTMSGKESDSYVVNAEHLVFCKNQIPGKEPDKDCMSEYVKDYKINKPIIPKPNTIYKSPFWS